MPIHVCLNSWMNFDYTKNGGTKAFHANAKHQYRVSQCGEHDCCANNKKMETIMSNQVYPISRMNFYFTKNGGKKALLANPKHQYHVS